MGCISFTDINVPSKSFIFSTLLFVSSQSFRVITSKNSSKVFPSSFMARIKSLLPCSTIATKSSLEIPSPKTRVSSPAFDEYERP